MNFRLVILFGILNVVTYTNAIFCYSCDSSNDFPCTENMDSEQGHPYISNCTNVYDSKYCIIMKGVYEGKLGTKRFCSSKDWGTYCEYIQRPGDPREYRSCISTCSTNLCNLS